VTAAPRKSAPDPAERNQAEAIATRANEIFQERNDANLKRTDRLFAYILLGQWVFGILLAVTLSPYTWEGKTRSIHLHVPIAIGLGALISSLPLFLIWKRPGAAGTRYTIAIAQMLWSALLIHLTGGRIETHFHVFGSLAFLAFYKDWKVLVPATVVVAADHLVRQIFWPESVFGIVAPESWRFLEHAFWVAFEDAFLVVSCVLGIRDLRTLAEQHARLEFTEQIQREMEIATHIQTAVLPRDHRVAGLEIAARMLPATEVGGDYYDVLPVSDGCWLGIGDVAGHGLEAGLVMLQAQSAVKALLLQHGERKPGDVLTDVNRVVYDNTRRRGVSSAHMTLSLLRYHDDGRVVVAGAHQDVIILRAATKRCELVRTEGTWIGLIEDVAQHNTETTFHLEDGDTIILYTDGLTEAGAEAATKGAFGVERLIAAVEGAASESSEAIRDAVFRSVAQWSKAQFDDITVLVARRRALRRAAAA
jgi:serine phosphatase RsbU (regulator of sigma subunit)